MKYRTTTVLAAKTLTGAQTETIPINVKDVISRLTVLWDITKVGVGMTGYPHLDIIKIELVDGSDVLFSMDGGEAAALNIYDRKCPTYWNGNNINGNHTKSWYSIDFGRWLYDELLALDPGRFMNLQLRVSVNPALCEALCTYGDLSVYADVFDEQVVTPAGFLMSKEHHKRTVPQSGYWYVDLPTDRPVRKMLIQGFESAFEPWYEISEARLDEDNEKRIPFDWNLETYHLLRKGIDTPVQDHIAGQANVAGLGLFTTPSDYWVQPIFQGHADASAPYHNGISRGGYMLVHRAAGTAYNAVVKGWLPNHCFQFPFGYQADITDWYDVTRLGSLRLRLRFGNAAAVGTEAVILQQNRSY